MGRTAGARGAFVAPQSRDYAYQGITAGRLSPLKSSTPTEAWLDDLERVVGLEVRGQVKAWVAGGLSEQRLKKAVRGAVDPKLVYERLVNSKRGIYQRRVVVDDYKNIIGIKKESFVENNLPAVAIHAALFGINDSAFDLPASNAATFTKEAKLVEVKPGEKLYRVTNDPISEPHAMTGGYWTRIPPKSLADVLGGTAVMPEWNNFQCVYEFTAPNHDEKTDISENYLPRIYAWEGPTAAQPVSYLYKEKVDNGYSLPGGDQQLFIPNIITRNSNFKHYIKDVTSSQKSW